MLFLLLVLSFSFLSNIHKWSFQRSVSSPERGSKNLQGSNIVRVPKR